MHPDLPNVDSNGGYIRFQFQVEALLSLQQKFLMKQSALNCTVSIMWYLCPFVCNAVLIIKVRPFTLSW